MTTSRPFGRTGLEFFPLGIGTIWFGRKWPPDNTSYKIPDDTEISNYLRFAYKNIGNKDGVIMLDTAAAYGRSEEKIGKFFRSHPEYLPRTFIATKPEVSMVLTGTRNHLKETLECMCKC